MPNTDAASETLRVKMIEIDENGNVTRRFPQIDAEGQLNKTLLRTIHRDISVLTVQVPRMILDQYEEALITQRIMRVTVDEQVYCLIGASGSAKDGKFYAVEEKYEKLIAERFQKWPQAAITYFGILVSDCQVVIEEPDTNILVVEDHALGTNDCRGWISERLFRKLELPEHRFYQFRLAFDKTQAKGSFKVMTDEVAALIAADIVIPESSIKPKLDLGFLDECQKWFAGLKKGIQGLRFRSPIALGIRDYSRELQFKSSYTLTEHASYDSLKTEIIPCALQEVRSVISTAMTGDYSKLLEAIGSSSAQGQVEDSEDAEYTSHESSIVEAVLKADGSGALIQHPFINNKLQQLLAKWAFKVSTGGGFRMPAFALADDGYLFVDDGQVFAGSDWVPENTAISSLTSKRGLVVRYPIRMKEDLLPVSILTFDETVHHLERVLRDTGCGMDSAHLSDLAERQLRIPGTFTLHSKTAERNGGDYDFDLVAVLEDSAFPRFVQSRFDMAEQHQKEKDKKRKIKSPWWNLAEVAMKARGNQIGRITNLISDCIAFGRADYAYELVDQLQNALDALKHNVQVDQEVMKRIRNSVPRAEWRSTKEAKRISEMPTEFSVPATDIVGQLYNHVRKEIGVLFQDTLPLRDFGGMIRGESFTREMHEECQKVNRTFGSFVSEQFKRTQQVIAELAKAKAEYDQAAECFRQAQARFEALKASKASHDEITAAVEFKRTEAESRWKAQRKFYRAQGTVRENEERCRERMRDFNRFLRAWGNGKKENRRGWCQTLHSIAVQSKSNKATGAIVFHAFPQELLDKLIEETGGRPIQLNLPEMPDGEIVFDASGNVYRVERIKLPDGQIQERRLFLFRVTEHGNILLDGVRRNSVQPFTLQEGSGQIRNGVVSFTNLTQRPTVRHGKPPALRTREDRQKFLATCERTHGSSFSVFVDGDPASVRQLDTMNKKQAFLESASARHWEALPFQPMQVQQ